MARFDFDTFSRDPQAVAQLVPASIIFTFLNRRASMPVNCMALAWDTTDQTSLIKPLAELESDSIARIMIVRATQIALDYHFAGLPCGDNHEISANIRVGVQLVPERSELTSFFRRVLGGAERVTQSQLLRHCEETVRLSTAAFCKARVAEDLIRIETWPQFDAEFADAFKALGFESGIALHPDVRAEFRSPGFADVLRQRKADEARKQRLDADAALRQAANEAREKHLGTLAAMTEKVRAMAATSGGISVPELVRTFDSAQRGELYGSLLQTTSTQKVKSILLAAGDEVLAVDPMSRRVAARRQIDAQFGPLRSVRVVKQGESMRILAGTRNAVHVLDSDLTILDTFNFEPPRPLRGGINSAAIRGDELCATHSEVGLIFWNMTGPKAHSLKLTELTSRAKAVRDVQLSDDETIWLAVDNLAVGLAPQLDNSPAKLETDVEISVLLTAGAYLYAGLTSGAVVRWPCKPPHDREQIRPRTGDAVESLDWLEGGGIPRLVVADKRPLIELRVLGDTYAAEYQSAQPIRWAWAAGDQIAAIPDRRDQLLLWDLCNHTGPAATIPIGRLTGHTIQDAAVLFA